MYSLSNIRIKNRRNSQTFSKDSKIIQSETISNHFNIKLIMDQKLSLITLISISAPNNTKDLNIFPNNMLKCVFLLSIWNKNIFIQKLEKKEEHMELDQVYVSQETSVFIPIWILKPSRHSKFLMRVCKRSRLLTRFLSKS